MTEIALYYDIDGCCHAHGTAKRNEHDQVRRFDGDGLFVWASKLQPILDEFPELALFCHSHWGNLYSAEEMYQQLPTLLALRTNAIVRPHNDRHMAIRAHAKESGVKNYVVLDDDAWAFPLGTPNIVIVPSETGLSTPGAVEMLRNTIVALQARPD